MTASALLRASRQTSGITQGELAKRSGINQPSISSIEKGKRIPTVNTLELLLQATGHRVIAVEVVGTTAAEAADRIAGATSRDSALRAFLDLSDSLERVTGIDRITLAIEEPVATGSLAWDAALAAVVDYSLTAEGLPTPRWVSSPSRTLSSPQSPQLGEYDLAPDITEVPSEFLRRNVLIERSTLASV